MCVCVFERAARKKMRICTLGATIKQFSLSYNPFRFPENIAHFLLHKCTWIFNTITSFSMFVYHLLTALFRGVFGNTTSGVHTKSSNMHCSINKEMTWLATFLHLGKVLSCNFFICVSHQKKGGNCNGQQHDDSFSKFSSYFTHTLTHHKYKCVYLTKKVISHFTGTKSIR